MRNKIYWVKLMMLKQRLRSGFTLLETTIGLSIVCSLALISLSNLRDYQAQIEERQALEWFKNSFKSAFNYSYLNHNVVTLRVEPGKNIVDFSHREGLKVKHVRKLFPKTLKLKDKAKVQYTIYNSGQAPPITIQFISSLTNKTYIYKIQMMWGEIIETTS
ncbi:type II secretion system protein [Lactobacillus halodurans]|uniref:Type II secretion system protein n=2 Tax=Companilactobacillus halodurans TaxID=2584183 RepID=A0A5P0ZYS8_9LACO|nr:type II secretion system protein [Companilactobacillus halodurans]